MSIRQDVLSAFRRADDWIFERCGRPRVLFVASDGNGFGCQSPVIRALRATGRTTVHVVAQDNRRSRHFVFNTEADRTLFEALRMDARLASLRKWHLVVYSHLCSFYPRRNALLAYMHHGPGFGSGGGHHAVTRCDLYFGLSEAEFSYLDDRLPGVLGVSKAYFPVGFPKVDSLVRGEFDRGAVRDRFRLGAEKTVLIASSWKSGGLVRALDAGPFEALAQAFPNWNVVQNGHPWLWQRRSDVDPAWQDQVMRRMREVEQRYPNARFLPNVPAEELAAVSDLLVADRTSVVTTFALLDRPIVLFDNPELPDYSRRAALPYLQAAEVFRHPDALIEACHTAMANPQDKRLERQKLSEMFYANPGSAAQEMAHAIEDLGRVCSTQSTGWPRVMSLSQRTRTSAT
ncbi:MAG TPA: CDP-glycerol glycerophosphotransferase family protein [Azoarcus taiwanensis]|uniref:CDP-glycerol glycerophosphotransferase family protein n=1 Tax=Thauera sp. TaxID=1905334 RepID=UPI002C098FC7|nr:CDP-glycerol glycerophosphotransferase family protein [Thauera sp.]HRP26093.1 CDP-glycerol glycerophosphotransferase family protein [Thauera sp.]HRQ59832.1 CDP-glycerol glycerophosphotransferase family protein [Azoarcus taiwanensis]